MATRYNFKTSTEERQRRIFSEDLKRKIVRDIESKKIKISEICREYEARDSTVRKWVLKYGMDKEKKIRVVVETESDALNVIKLQQKVAELERIIGQKQIELDFNNKMIELAEEEYNIDIKKKSKQKPSDGSGSTGNV